MSIVSGSSNTTEVPGVNNSVQHLQELAERMRSDEYGFKENDVNTIDRIIEALHELDAERAKRHEELEVETIEASILRHRLHFLPGQIKEEISAAVDSARQSNADELTRLQARLDNINKNIDFLENKHKEVEQENATLHPERDRVRKVHEGIIMQLNQKLAEKAGKQIVLNETRDKLRETNAKIVDLEDSILQLKEDLIQERADARMEKKRLKKAVYDTTLKTREQKEANVAKKKEVDELNEKVMESEAGLDNIRKSIRRFETSKSRLEGQERALVAQYNKEIKQNQELKQKGEEITKQTALEKEEFIKTKGGLEDRLQGLNTEIEGEQEKYSDLISTKQTLEQELEKKQKSRKEDEEVVKSVNADLQAIKLDLVRKAEEVARLAQENIAMEAHIEELQETHKSIMLTLTKQIEEARETLGKERKERMELQEQRDNVSKDLEDFKQETNRYMADMNKRINDGKNMHDQLTKEGTDLQKAIRKDDETIKQLKVDIQHAEKDYQNETNKLNKEISDLQAEIAGLEEKLKDKKALLYEKTPVFWELEELFKQKTEEYEKIKKSIVSLKSQKMGLEDANKRSKREIERMVNPRAELEKNLKKKREETIEIMKEEAEEVREVETHIYTIGCKLRTAMSENDRFVESNTFFESEIENIKKQMGDNDNVVAHQIQHLIKLREELAENWGKDQAMEERVAARDQVLVEGLGELLKKTGRREGIISDITGKLETELLLLAQFLDNVASRRPKDTRQGTRGRRGNKQLAVDTGGLEGTLTREATQLSMNAKSPLPPITPRSPKVDGTLKTPKPDGAPLSPRPDKTDKPLSSRPDQADVSARDITLNVDNAQAQQSSAR